ncbi:MAG: FMN-binding protein [Clostridia bacterium]
MSNDTNEKNINNSVSDTKKALDSKIEDAKKPSIGDENSAWLKVEKVIADCTLALVNFFKTNEIPRLCLILCLVTSTTAFLLGMVNEITAPIIADIKMGATKDAMMLVVPEADEFETLSVPSGSNSLVSDFYTASSGSNLLAYFVKVNPNGYGGVVELLVGLDANGAVISTDIINNAETPGIGDKAFEVSFTDQFIGKSTTLVSGSDISVISGSTVTSNAMISGVSAAIEFVASNK